MKRKKGRATDVRERNGRKNPCKKQKDGRRSRRKTDIMSVGRRETLESKTRG